MFILFFDTEGLFNISDKNEAGRTNEVPISDRPQTDVNGIPKEGAGFAKYTSQFYIYPKSGNDAAEKEAHRHFDQSGQVNMEAAINADDVIRAGGYGARDDLSSFLPVASDSTDFEASLLDARDYEEPRGEQPRPGLGWSEDRESK